MLPPLNALTWSPPASWRRVETLDAHAGGEPLRIVLAGYPDLQGETILDRRRYALEHLDDWRRALMFEPRGHADMYGCLFTPAVTPTADLGVLFTHNEGYSTMCGHAILALTTALIQTESIAVTEPLTTVRYDTPAGLVTAYAEVEAGQVQRVFFRNVPSFVIELDAEIEVPGLGTVRYDLAFGGAFYAYVDGTSLGLTGRPSEVERLIDLGRRIKHAVMAQRTIPHPTDPELGFLYGTIFTMPPLTPHADSRNVCIFAEGEVDRSPTGTGVSGRVAIEHARGTLALGETLTVESIVGSVFAVRPVEAATCGGFAAVVPEVEGTAHLTGRHSFWIDPADPFREGFLLR
ncbi:MAG: proline racemase family protein [Bacteroidota bacterium]